MANNSIEWVSFWFTRNIEQYYMCNVHSFHACSPIMKTKVFSSFFFSILIFLSFFLFLFTYLNWLHMDYLHVIDSKLDTRNVEKQNDWYRNIAIYRYIVHSSLISSMQSYFFLLTFPPSACYFMWKQCNTLFILCDSVIARLILSLFIWRNNQRRKKKKK